MPLLKVSATGIEQKMNGEQSSSKDYNDDKGDDDEIEL